MRFRYTAYVLLVALAACGSSSAASDASSTATGPTAPRATRCGPRAAKTLRASRAARVYALRGQVYGCAFGHGRSYLLGASTRSIREERVGPLALAGVVAGYGLRSYGVDTVSSAVIVRDLTSGRQLRALPANTKVGPESIQTVNQIVLGRDGAVAWIAETMSIIGRGSAQFEVQRADARGHSVLDSGRSIQSHSLRLRGSTLTWRDAGGLRSATLR
jgi:hypothetical protein